MTSELNHQSNIIKDVKDQFENAFAIKMSNRFQSGVPDLMIKVPKHPIMLVEVKKGEINKKGIVKINTTPIQRYIMQHMQKSGIRCEVWTIIEDNKDCFMLRTRPEITSVLIIEKTNLPLRTRGVKWPIENFLDNPLEKNDE
jgi:hypothetical protein